MNEHNRDSQERVALQVSFDIDQISHALCWQFDGPHGNLFHTTGIHAGAVHVEHGAVMCLDVTVYARGRSLAGVEINSATLGTMPRQFGPIPFPPSPFRGESASADFGRFELKSFEFDPLRDMTVAKLVSTNELQVVTLDGSWQMSLLLSATLTRANNAKETRVFQFDPEYQVGNGTRPPSPGPGTLR